MRAGPQPATAPLRSVKCVPRPGRAPWPSAPGPGHRSAASRASRARPAHDLFARQPVTSIVFDVELIYLARRRGYRIAVVPIRWSDKRGSRMHPGPRLGMRVAWDLFRIPLLHRRVGAADGASVAVRERGRDVGAALARLTPLLLLVLLAATVGAVLAAAGDTLGYDFEAYARAADRVLTGEPLYDPAIDVAGGFAIFLYPPPFVIAAIPFRCSRSRVGRGCGWSRCSSLLPRRDSSPARSNLGALGDRRTRGGQPALPLRAEARSGRSHPLSLLRDRVARAGPAGLARPVVGRWCPRQGPATPPVRVDARHPALGGARRRPGRHRRGHPLDPLARRGHVGRLPRSPGSRQQARHDAGT